MKARYSCGVIILIAGLSKKLNFIKNLEELKTLHGLNLSQPWIKKSLFRFLVALLILCCWTKSDMYMQQDLLN